VSRTHFVVLNIVGSSNTQLSILVQY